MGKFFLVVSRRNRPAAQLIFMAWLQRVVNSGRIIDSEYGVGRGRIDILIRWSLPEGLAQIERYIDRL
jgi:hypothetical protein